MMVMVSAVEAAVGTSTKAAASAESSAATAAAVSAASGSWHKQFLLNFCLLDHGEEIILGENGDAQFSSLTLLGTGIFADHHEAGLLGDRAGSLAAE